MPLSSEDILSGLNPAQREAVLHGEGPLMILAGAGSGKTRVITHRIGYLVGHGVPLDGILAITFTNKAAAEMRDRAERICGQRSAWICTFHSLAARILRRHIYRLEPYDTSFTICDRDDALAVVKEVIKSLDLDPRLWEPGAMLAELSRVKNASDGGEPVFRADHFHGHIFREVFLGYHDRLRERNLLDFDDLQLCLVRLFREHPDVLSWYSGQFHHVLVDEYQDTNAVQYNISRLLAHARRNLCVTGDPDQSIYRWRGADINNILNFERDYPEAKTIRLEQNYRSTMNILRTANELIVHNSERKDKSLWSEKPDGEPVRVHRFLDERVEAREAVQVIRGCLDEGFSPGDIAVFYRLNSLSRPVEQELIYANVPYSIVGGVEFFLRREVKDILAYLRTIDNPRDSESVRRILNVPPRGIGKSTVDALVQTARQARRGLLDLVLSDDLCPKLPRRQTEGLRSFRRLHGELRALAKGSVAELLRAVVETTGYQEYLLAQKTDDVEDRLSNLSEILGTAVEYERTHPDGTLTGFLELSALLADVDRWEHRGDRVSLMTLHSAKGLEFPVVIVVGVEEGILPLLRATDPNFDVEEERRLLYVGITRAQQRLYLTHTTNRMRFGQPRVSFPSRFLGELESPGETAEECFQRLEMDVETEDSLRRGRRAESSLWVLANDEPEVRLPQRKRRRASPSIDRFSQDDPEPPDSAPAEAAAGGDNQDDGFEADEDPFAPGARVWHDEYGAGEVLRTSGAGPRRRVTVRFEEAGEKQFVAGYTPLRRLR